MNYTRSVYSGSQSMLAAFANYSSFVLQTTSSDPSMSISLWHVFRPVSNFDGCSETRSLTHFGHSSNGGELVLTYLTRGDFHGGYWKIKMPVNTVGANISVARILFPWLHGYFSGDRWPHLRRTMPIFGRTPARILFPIRHLQMVIFQ